MKKLDTLSTEILEQFIDRYRTNLSETERDNYNAIRQQVRNYASESLEKALLEGQRQAHFLGVNIEGNPLFEMAVRDGLIRWYLIWNALEDEEKK